MATVVERNWIEATAAKEATAATDNRIKKTLALQHAVIL